MPNAILNILLILGGIIVFLVLLELLALPDWIGRKLRGEVSRKEIIERLRSLETRMDELERKTGAN